MNRFFHYKDRGGTLGGEIAAGLGMFFLSTCGIFLNMQLIAKQLIFAEYTASNANQIAYNGNMYALTWFVSMLIAVIGSLLIGIVAGLPLVQTGGLGLSAVIVSMIGVETGLNYYNLLFVCFISAIVYALLVAIPGVRERILKAIPVPVRKALPAASGLYLAWIAIQLTGIFSLQDSQISAYGAGEILENGQSAVKLFGILPLSGFSYTTDMYHPLLLICGISVVVTILLYLFLRRRSKRPFLFTLLGGTLVFLILYALTVCVNFSTMKASVDSLWGRLWMVGSEDAMQTHISTILQNIQYGQIFSVGSNFDAYREAGGNVTQLFAVGIGTFVLLNLTDADATLQVVGADTGVSEQEGQKKLWLAQLMHAAANMIAPILGASPVEIGKASVAGSKDGAKSGLASIIASIGFIVSTFFWIVPFLFATNFSYNITFNLYGHQGTVLQLLGETGFVIADIVMALVGLNMAAGCMEIEWKKVSVAAPFAATVAGTILFSNLACGAAIGTIVYVIAEFTRKKEAEEEEGAFARIGVGGLIALVVSVLLIVLTIQ